MTHAKRPPLVCITGMDGTGKTTLAKALVGQLNARGIRARYVYARYRPLTVRLAWALGRRLLRARKRGSYPEYRDEKRRRLKASPFKTLYAGWLLFEYVLELQVLVRARLLAGVAVVCDRYAFDTAITDVGKELGMSDEACVALARRWMRFVPTPDLVFVLDAPEEVAFARKTDVPDIEYLRDVRGAYRRLAEANGYTLIDATAPAEAVAAVVGTRLEQEVPCVPSP